MQEWTLDWYDADWYAATQAGCSDCANLSTASYRVIRGGTWQDDAEQLRSANREGRSPDSSRFTVGLRCARSVP